MKAWKTVSEIDALLGSDFRPSTLPTCDEDRPSGPLDDTYVKVRLGKGSGWEGRRGGWLHHSQGGKGGASPAVHARRWVRRCMAAGCGSGSGRA